MELTVREILNMDFMQDAEIIAGKDNIERFVKYVDVMEVPDIDEWLREGVFLLTTGYNIKDDLELQERMIKKMSEVKAGALCIKEGRYLEKIPDFLINLGEEYNLPIIKIPKDVHYNSIMLPLFSKILGKKNNSISRFENIHNELVKVILKGGGIDLLAQTLHKLIEKPVLIQDKNLKTLALIGEYNEEKKIKKNISITDKKLLNLFTFNRKATRIKYEDATIARVVAPIFVTDKIYGFVSAFEIDNNKLDNIDFRAVELTSTNIALELLKEKDKEATQNRLKEELIEDLINDNYNDEKTIYQRAKYFGWDLRSDYHVIVIDIDNFEEYYLSLKSKDEDVMQRIKENIKSIIKWELMMLNKDIIIINQSDSFVVLYKSNKVKNESKDKKELENFCHKTKSSIKQQISHITVSIGIGNLYKGIDGLKKSYKEAFKALSMGKNIYGQNKITRYDDLGIYRVIAKLNDDPDLIDFYEEVIGSLVNNPKNEELVDTVESIIKNFGNKTAAAKELCIHRNTLNYRIKKIEKILEVDLDNPENYLNLYMALKIKQLL